MDSSSLIGRTISHYNVTGLIGQGGMGVVYRAHDLRLERDVALKVLRAGALGDETARKKFRAEALSLSRLNHPNIATIHDFDSADGIDFVVMECVAGEPLSERVRASSLPGKQAIAVGIQICSALEAAHEKGVIHRDLKPQNILLAAQGQVKVVDFGLAKLIQPGSDPDITLTMTDTDAQAGTLPYMAPEQLRGEATDARTDIWSTGAVLYEICTAQRPFPETRSTALIAAILNKDPIPPHEVNPRTSLGLEQIILKALDKDPARRYQSAREMRVDLERLGDVRKTVAATAADRTLWWRAAAIGTAAAAVVFAGVWIGMRWWQSRQAPQASQTVLVGEFVNRTNNAMFDLTLAELVKTALEESRAINVFPASRIPDVLHLIKKPATAPIDEATGREICELEGLRAVVLGSIILFGDSYTIEVRAVDQTGHDVVSSKQTVRDPGKIVSAVDALVKKVRTALGESAVALNKVSVPLAQVTSDSLEAIRDYTLGNQRTLAGDPQGAIAFYRKALELDPSFAMAKEGIGVAFTNLNDPIQAEEYLRDAANDADRVTEVEKQKLLGNYHMMAGNYDQACADFQVLTQLQPLDPTGFGSLGWCEGLRFHFDVAIANTGKAAAMLPTARLKMNLAMLHFLNGDTEKALGLFQDVLQDQPKISQAREITGTAQALLGKMQDAQATFEAMIQDGGLSELLGLNRRADLALASGHYRDAKTILKTGRLDAQKLGNSTEGAKIELLLAQLNPGTPLPADSNLHSVQWLQKNPSIVLLLGRMYAGRHQNKEIQGTIKVMEGILQKRNSASTHSEMFLLQAEAAMANGKPTEAVDASRNAIEYENSPLAVETLARACDAAGQFQEAAAQYEALLKRANQRCESDDSPAFHKVVETHYRLGVVYQKIGKSDASKQALEKFLSFWTDPDPDLEIYKDAVGRIRALRERAEPSSGIPTPARYKADSEIPSTRRSRSIRFSLITAVQNGANPSQLATRQKVWQTWPASSSTTR
jgi:tetratricopeptide (TPR) repeat protein/predicted Ser/Thr protein kinase